MIVVMLSVILPKYEFVKVMASRDSSSWAWKGIRKVNCNINMEHCEQKILSS